MMRKCKMFGTFIISLLVCSLFVSVYSGWGMGTSGFTAEEKLPALLSDVIGLDLSKYDKVEGSSYYGIKYLYDGAVEVEQCGFDLVDTKGNVIGVNSEFYNGFPQWLLISRVEGSLYSMMASPKGSGDLQSFFERYMIFAQTYDISTVDQTASMNLFNKAPWFLPANELSPAKIVSDDMTLYMSQKSFRFNSVIEDIEIPSKSLGVSFTDDKIQFYDTFGFYNVCDVNLFSKEEFTSFALDVAQTFCDTFFVSGEEGVSIEWALERSNVGLNMIPGQIYNNPLNDELLAAGLGTSYSKERDALTLYPMWQAIFYFSQNIDNIHGVQVGVWGDTGEVAYCWETGHLGAPAFPSDGSSEQTNSSGDLLTFAVIALIALFMVTAVAMFIGKNGKMSQKIRTILNLS